MRLGALGAAGYGLYETVKPTAANAGENERARQLKYGQGWLSNAPPDAGKFSLPPGGLGAFRLEGAADIGVRVDVGFDQGLLAKQISQTLNARGNLRADTGVSMPQSMLPR